MCAGPPNRSLCSLLDQIDLKVCEFVHDSRGFYLFKKAERVERNPHWICRSDYEKGIQAWVRPHVSQHPCEH
jgi:hypothetical protein